MHSQLMCTASVRIEGEECYWVMGGGRYLMAYHSVLCDSSLTVLVVYYLTRTVKWVAAKWKVDYSMIGGDFALNYSHVFLLDSTSGKLVLQVMIGLSSLCHKHNARCEQV